MKWKVKHLPEDTRMGDTGLEFYANPVYRIVVKRFCTAAGTLENKQRSIQRKRIESKI